MAVGGILVVLTAVVVSLTVLPVLLSYMGAAVIWPRTQLNVSPEGSGIWGRWADVVMRRRWRFLIAGLAIPTMLTPVERGWMALAHAISKVTTPIVMGIIYLVVLTPVGLLRRNLGSNPLVHQADTPGFWKTHHNDWVGYAPTDLVGSVFAAGGFPSLADDTLDTALGYGGGPGALGGARRVRSRLGE